MEDTQELPEPKKRGRPKGSKDKKPRALKAARGTVMRERCPVALIIQIPVMTHRALKREAKARGCSAPELARVLIHNQLFPISLRRPVPPLLEETQP